MNAIPEAERNRLLRRVDWRFLIPSPTAPAAHAPGGGEPAAALALVAGDDEPPAVVALVDPGRAEVERAAAALPPGGALYVEWTRPRIGVRRRLASAGLERARWYWRWPPRAPSFWLPLDAPDALAWFLAPRRRARPWSTGAWTWGRRLRLLAPLAAVARKPGGRADAIEAAVGPAGWILLTGGRRSVNKVVGIPVAAGAARPALVVKFARSEDEDASLRREHDVLGVVAARRPELPGVPRPLFLERRWGRLALGETALEGEPLVRRLDAATFEGLAGQVTDWLVALAGAGDRRPRSEWAGRLVDAPLDRLAREFGRVLDGEEVAAARAALAALDDLPLVCEQRDLAPWNVLVHEDGLAVADWESAEPDGLPGLDLVYFLTSAALQVAGVMDSEPYGPTHAATLDAGTPLGRVVAACQASYCARVGIDPRLLPALRLLCWTIHAHSEHRRLEVDAAAAPTRAALRSSMFLALWRSELA